MNRNLVIFLLMCGLGVGAILVYAKNNMGSPSSTNPNSNLTQFNNPPPPSAQQNDQVLSSQNTNTNQSPQNSQANPQNNQGQPQSQGSPQAASNPFPTGPIHELIIKDIIVGSGAEVKTGDNVEVNYLGTFLDGTKFDSSYDRNQTFKFTVGAGNVIKGWDQGLIGMKTGGKRQLVIPSDLAYGQAGAPGAIPPNTPLAFEIELVSVNSPQ